MDYDILDLITGDSSNTAVDLIQSAIAGWNQPAQEIQVPQLSGINPVAQMTLALGMLKAQRPNIAMNTANSIMSGISYGLDQSKKKRMKDFFTKQIDSGKLEPKISIGSDGKAKVTFEEANSIDNLKKQLEVMELGEKIKKSSTANDIEQSVQNKLFEIQKQKEQIDSINKINKVREAQGLPPVDFGSAMPGQRQAANKLAQGQEEYNRLADYINTQKGRKVIDKIGDIQKNKVITQEEALKKGEVDKGTRIVKEKKSSGLTKSEALRVLGMANDYIGGEEFTAQNPDLIRQANEVLNTGNSTKAPLSSNKEISKYKAGETRTINGTTYKRNKEGQWLPI